MKFIDYDIIKKEIGLLLKSPGKSANIVYILISLWNYDDDEADDGFKKQNIAVVKIVTMSSSSQNLSSQVCTLLSVYDSLSFDPISLV